MFDTCSKWSTYMPSAKTLATFDAVHSTRASRTPQRGHKHRHSLTIPTTHIPPHPYSVRRSREQTEQKSRGNVTSEVDTFMHDVMSKGDGRIRSESCLVAWNELLLGFDDRLDSPPNPRTGIKSRVFVGGKKHSEIAGSGQ